MVALALVSQDDNITTKALWSFLKFLNVSFIICLQQLRFIIFI